MNSWVFYINDSRNRMTAVVGIGADKAEAEASARTKWELFAVGRPDHDQRSPIVSVLDAGLSTEMDSDNMPGLIL